MLWHKIQGAGGAGGGGGGDISFVASSSFTNVIPESTSTGDLILLFEQPNGSTSDPGTPSGFTRIFFGSGAFHGQAWSYRIAQSGDAGSTVVLASGGSNRTDIVVFSSSTGTITYGGSFDVEFKFTSGNPTPHTILASSGTKPLVALVAVRTGGDAVSSSFTSTDNLITLVNGAVNFSSGYKIFNPADTAVDITVDSGDGGTRNSLVSMYIQLS
jgi:hypothetical protein